MIFRSAAGAGAGRVNLAQFFLIERSASASARILRVCPPVGSRSRYDPAAVPSRYLATRRSDRNFTPSTCLNNAQPRRHSENSPPSWGPVWIALRRRHHGPTQYGTHGPFFIKRMNKAGKLKDCKMALTVLNKALNNPDIDRLRMYNAAFTAISNCGEWEQALTLLLEMKAKGTDPDIVSYMTLLTLCAKHGQWDKALKLLREMPTKRISPDVLTYNEVLKALRDSGRWQIALNLFEEMHAKGLVTNTVSYNAVIAACGNCGQWEKALELFNEMIAKGTKPSVVSYEAVIKACRDAGQEDKADKLLREVRDRGISPC